MLQLTDRIMSSEGRPEALEPADLQPDSCFMGLMRLAAARPEVLQTLLLPLVQSGRRA